MVNDREHLPGELTCAARQQDPSTELGNRGTAGDCRPPVSASPTRRRTIKGSGHGIGNLPERKLAHMHFFSAHGTAIRCWATWR